MTKYREILRLKSLERMPNSDYIRKELLRNGVNKKLLWVEYCGECRMSSEEPLIFVKILCFHRLPEMW